VAGAVEPLEVEMDDLVSKLTELDERIEEIQERL
jgi:hypothetical protein